MIDKQPAVNKCEWLMMQTATKKAPASEITPAHITAYHKIIIPQKKAVTRESGDILLNQLHSSNSRLLTAGHKT